MSSKPWYAWYPADYRAKTAHLSYLQDAAYRRMLDAYYERSGPLPTDRPSLFRICSAMTPEEQQAISFIADSLFYPENNELHHKRCDEEIVRQAQIRARLSDAGKRGASIAGRGRPKKGLNSNSAKGLAQANPQSQSQITKTLSGKPNGAETWQAYAEAYLQRYRVAPVRNAKVNSIIGKIVASIGHNDAPHVAAFYVGLNSSWYVAKGHAIQFLLADAEKIRTEWATGRQITQTEALQADKRQSNRGVFEKLIAESEHENPKP